jgi:CP family cyanate transporter-like MFS transporter
MPASRASEPADDLAWKQALLPVALLWLVGIGLRLTILAVPPVIPLIHDDLALSETEVGVLTGLPSLLFALAAVPGSLIIARFGAPAAAIIGLIVTGIAGALRGSAPNAAVLFAFTIATGLGVAIMQPAMPSLVRQWLPRRIGFGTAVYTNGLLIGEILPVTLTIPLILPLLAGSWRLDFLMWGFLAVALALIILALVARAPAGDAVAVDRRWWPDWRSGLLWRLGLLLGTVTADYFATNAFLPDYLTATGQSELIGPALTALNVGQLPASFLLLAVAGRIAGRLWPLIATGLITLVGYLGVVLGSGTVMVAATFLLGFSLSVVLILMLALPPLISAPQDLHRLSAAMFTISYSCAVVVPIISGLAWDLTGTAAAAFVPMAAAAVATLALALGLGLHRHGK